jgi:hypothetical protein
VLVRPANVAVYLSSSEIVWDARSAPVRVHPAWLRDLRAADAGGGVSWVGAADAEGVECGTVPGQAGCRFVPAGAAGVMVSDVPGGVLFAVVPRGASGGVAWQMAASGRLIRARPPGPDAVAARAITIERAIKQTAGHLREARVTTAVRITHVDLNAFWIEGTVAGGYLELRSRGAATTRVPLSSLSGSAAVPFEVRLPPEEVIAGVIQAGAALAEGVTVVISRLIDEDSRANRDVDKKEDDPPLERLAEAVTGPNGEFRFEGLGRERYEVFAVHPAHGRARAVVTPPAYPRLQLKPRAIVRGRVLENGIPRASALIRMLPSLEAVVSARNPLLLATEPARTGPDGRFQVIAPDEGLVVLEIATERMSQRVDLGDAASLGEVVELGDIRLEDPRELELFVDLPGGCRLQAAGPLGVAGMTVLAPTAVSAGHWRFTPPAGGRWLFAAICGREEVALVPAVIDIKPGRRDPIVLKVRR